MNQEVKTKWVTALRSGEYNQGKAYLRRDDDTYCCLGVLCDLYAKDKNLQWSKHPDRKFYDLEGEASILPEEVLEWAELPAEDHRVIVGVIDIRVPHQSTALVTLNDHYDFSFEDIANVIEKQL